MASKLDQLRAMTVLVADTGDIDAVRRLKPQDCTTNPMLLPQKPSRCLVMLGCSRRRWAGRAGRADRARPWSGVCDRLAVALGAELAAIVPGRVSTEVDADLSFDTQGSIAKAREIVRL